VLAVLAGLAYPLLVTGLGRVAGSRADGQIVYREGEAVGSRAIGQAFASDMFFQGRPSAAGDGYDAMRSGGSNLGPSNPDLTEAARDRIFELLERNPGLRRQDIPVELVTASASGLDPDICEESAMLQVPRVAAATGLAEEPCGPGERTYEGPLPGHLRRADGECTGAEPVYTGDDGRGGAVKNVITISRQMGSGAAWWRKEWPSSWAGVS